MQFRPHNYQQFASEYICENPAAAILLDMGLGKTVITLTAVNDLLFDYYDVEKILVIAPLRVANSVWRQEAEKWEHLHRLKISVATGTAEQRRSALQAKAHIYVINRENVQWLLEKSGLPFDYDMLVIDELSSFKSPTAKRFKALKNVRPRIKRIVGLTGTPCSNGLMDLWAQFRLLDMGKRLGKFIGQYRSEYFLPDKRDGLRIFTYKPKMGAEQRIYDRIADISISMKAVDHLQMPELLSVEHKVALSAKERKIYQELKTSLVMRGTACDVTASNAAALCGKLAQMANGAIYNDHSNVTLIHDHKLDMLEDLIEAANGKPVLVAYWYRHDLDRILERLTALKIPHTQLVHPSDIDLWNGGEYPVAVIHPASAGHGLNLQRGGNTIIWFGLTWSLELYQQTNARLWRQGQSAGVVTLHHIITEGTIDVQILYALARKDKTQSALIEAVKANLGVE
jgi:SNF2 family DNA or RNA helicase